MRIWSYKNEQYLGEYGDSNSRIPVMMIEQVAKSEKIFSNWFHDQKILQSKLSSLIITTSKVKPHKLSFLPMEDGGVDRTVIPRRLAAPVGPNDILSSLLATLFFDF